MTSGTNLRARPRPEKNLFQLVTPEGVPLQLEIALAGDRLTAFFFDAMIIVFATLFLQLFVLWSGVQELRSIFLLVFFVLRNFYFTILEHRWQGATWGKKNRKLRVIDAHGGQLSVEAIIVRNLTRDLETFVPLAILLAPQTIWPDAPGFIPPLAGLWVLVLGFMPLFNKQRRRVGDLIAGTIVIRSPQIELLGDLADNTHEQNPSGESQKQEMAVFTKKQLSVYGVYELQVLENLLRKSGLDAGRDQMANVREKICEKIEWKGKVENDQVFLEAFYAAQRAHLESGLLMGKRREDKFADETGGPAEAQEKEED